jgi:hypothetical protein
MMTSFQNGDLIADVGYFHQGLHQQVVPTIVEGQDRRLIYQDPVCFLVHAYALFLVRDTPGALHQLVEGFVLSRGVNPA